MKITWTDVAARLKFDDRQTILGEYLVNRGKDATFDLWTSASDDGGPTPIDYAVELSSLAPEDPETGPRMVEFLKGKKKRGAASSYLQLQYETEKPIVTDIVRLLNPDQAAAFVKLDVGSLLLDIDTGYRPIDEHISSRVNLIRHGTPPPMGDAPVADGDWSLTMVPLLRIKGVTDDPGSDLADVCAALSLDPRQATILKYLLELLQHQCAELWSAVTHDYRLSPFEYLVDLELSGDGGRGPVERPFVEYLRTAQKIATDQSYFAIQAQLERALHHDLNRMLGRDVTAPLHALGIGSFLSIATGNEPIAYRLLMLREENKLKRGIDLFCSMPFEYVHIEDTGDVLPCCPSKFRLSIGNLKKDSMQEVWSSRAAEAVRESIHDKTFRFCNYHACEYLKQGRNKNATAD